MTVYLSAAISLDGYLDDTSSERLILSSAEDWDEVRRLRADSDAVLVGAGTVRRDNPALVTRSGELRELRLGRGLPADPVKVTVSRSGDLDPHSRFFTEGTGEKIVITGPQADPAKLQALESVASILKTSETVISASRILRLLEQRGIRRLFVEGGSRILALFLEEGAADYLRLAVAPFFVADPAAPRLAPAAGIPFTKERRMHLIRSARAGDMAVMEYALRYDSADYAYLERAIDEARNSPPSEGAYSVGALIVTAGNRIFTGYSRETGEHNHAEEEAISKAVAAGEPLCGATIYSSMEPCSTRRSKPFSCSELIIKHRMKRVVFATYEPANFVTCCGEQRLRDAGVEVTVIPELAAAALDPNGHILGPSETWSDNCCPGSRA